MNLYIVTGTTQGLGQALAMRIGARSDNELVALARAPEGPIGGGVRLEVDLADARALDAAFDRIEQRLRGKRYSRAVLINNAGTVVPVGPLERCDGSELERSLLVNLVAPVLLMRRFLIATEGVAKLRRIINISSRAARRAVPGWTAYCTAKAGLEMASRVVAADVAGRGDVEVVSLSPGVIDTAMQDVVRGTDEKDFPERPKFLALKADGGLRPAADVAEEILRLEVAGQLTGDVVLDLRTIAAKK